MLAPNTIYRKTDAGVNEIATRRLGLRAELRRVLIMADAKHTVHQLNERLRSITHDRVATEALTELLALSLIEPLRTTNNATSASASASASMTQVQTLSDDLKPLSVIAARGTPLRNLQKINLNLHDVATPAVPIPPLHTIDATVRVAPLQPTIAQFEAAQAAAINAIKTLIGSSGQSLVLAIEACTNAQTLRSQVLQIRTSLSLTEGEPTATRFLEIVQAAAKAR